MDKIKNGQNQKVPKYKCPKSKKFQNYGGVNIGFARECS
jgi:hypothetical protein